MGNLAACCNQHDPGPTPPKQNEISTASLTDASKRFKSYSKPYCTVECLSRCHYQDLLLPNHLPMSPVPANTIWQEIETFAAPSETDALLSIIGRDLVEQNEALHEEASALGTILIELSNAGGGATHSQPPPTHPARKYLEEQIFMLLNRESCRTLEALQGLGEGDAKVKEYVLQKQEDQNGHSRKDRPQSSSSLSPQSNRTPASTRVLLMKDSINVFEVDSIVSKLRDALADEKEELLQAISDLHEDIELAGESQRHQDKPEPTLEEMKQYSKKLESYWLLESVSGGVSSRKSNETSEIVPTPPATPRSGSSSRQTRRSKKVARLRMEVMHNRKEAQSGQTK